MLHAVIFDVDDTLLHSMADDDRLYRQAIRDVLGEGVRFRETLADYEHVSDTGILRQVLADNRVADAERHFDVIRERFLDALERHVEQHGPFREIEGAREMLERVRAAEQYAVALATGCWRRSAELKLRTAGFELDGIPLATADDAVERVGIMQHALRSLGSDFASVTYYGDGVWDREACRALEWTFRPVGAALGGLMAYHDEFRT